MTVFTEVVFLLALFPVARVQDIDDQEGRVCCLSVGDAQATWYCEGQCPPTMYDPHPLANETSSGCPGQFNAMCLPCLDGCFSCTSQTECMRCLGTYTLHITSDGEMQCFSGESCREGFYLASDDVWDINICHSCPHDCAACWIENDTVQCEGCEEGLFLLDYGLQSRTTTGLITSSIKTEPISSSSRDERAETTSTPPTITLSYLPTTLPPIYECVEECPKEFYADNSTFKCELCHSECLSCNGPSSQDCIVCSNFVFHNTSTISSCVEKCSEIICRPGTKVEVIQRNDSMSEKGVCECVSPSSSKGSDSIQPGALVAILLASLAVLTFLVLLVLWATGFIQFQNPCKKKTASTAESGAGIPVDNISTSFSRHSIETIETARMSSYWRRRSSSVSVKGARDRRPSELKDATESSPDGALTLTFVSSRNASVLSPLSKKDNTSQSLSDIRDARRPSLSTSNGDLKKIERLSKALHSDDPRRELHRSIGDLRELKKMAFGGDLRQSVIKREALKRIQTYESTA